MVGVRGFQLLACSSMTSSSKDLVSMDSEGHSILSRAIASSSVIISGSCSSSSRPVLCSCQEKKGSAMDYCSLWVPSSFRQSMILSLYDIKTPLRVFTDTSCPFDSALPGAGKVKDVVAFENQNQSAAGSKS